MSEELRKAKEELDSAQNQFNNASKDFIDVAIYRLNAAEAHYAVLLNIEKEKAGLK